MTRGSLSQADGPLFYVTNATGAINLTAVRLSAASGVLLKAAADQWGTSGSNGGHATLNAVAQTLTGNVVADSVSDVTITLAQGSALSGVVDGADTAKSVSMTLDASSTWTVTGDSHVTTLSDSAGISATSVKNIVGNGHTVYYDSAANPGLGGKTYTLSGGGTLVPE